MVVRERVVVYTIVDLGVGVARSLSAELPYGPVFAMFGVEELYERVKRVAVCALRIGAAGAGRRNDCTPLERARGYEETRRRLLLSVT